MATLTNLEIIVLVAAAVVAAVIVFVIYLWRRRRASKSTSNLDKEPPELADVKEASDDDIDSTIKELDQVSDRILKDKIDSRNKPD